jgi:hypothetical protein
LQRSKLFWVYLILEKNIRYAYSFIQNRNDCADIYDNNFFGFFAMLYLETHNSLTPKLLEGFLYAEYSLADIFYVSFSETKEYQLSYLFAVMSQKYLMGCPISINWPVGSLLYSKQFVSGFCHITYESQNLVMAVVTVIFTYYNCIGVLRFSERLGTTKVEKLKQ